MNKTVLMIVVVLCSLVAIGDACPSCDTYPCLGVPLCRRSASSQSKDISYISFKYFKESQKAKKRKKRKTRKTERQRDGKTKRQKGRKIERQKNREMLSFDQHFCHK